MHTEINSFHNLLGVVEALIFILLSKFLDCISEFSRYHRRDVVSARSPVFMARVRYPGPKELDA